MRTKDHLKTKNVLVVSPCTGAAVCLLGLVHLQTHENSGSTLLSPTLAWEHSNTRSARQRVECVISAPDRLIGRHLAIRLDAVLQAKELPARISNLHTTLRSKYWTCFVGSKWMPKVSRTTHVDTNNQLIKPNKLKLT